MQTQDKGSRRETIINRKDGKGIERREKRYRIDKGMMKGSETDMLYKRQGGRNRENNDNTTDA